VRALVAVVALSAGISSAQHGVADPEPDHEPDIDTGIEVGGRPFRVRTIAPGVLVHVGRHEDAAIGNAADVATLAAVVGERSIALIDAGGSALVAHAWQRAIRAHSDLPISHLVLTHAHPDHVLGAGAFADVPVIVAHAGFAPARAARRAHDAGRFAELLPARAAPTPSIALGVGQVHEIDLGGRRVQVRALPPAHTDHDLIVADPLTGTLFAGDVVVGERLPSLDGDLLGWIQVLERLADRSWQRIVPGHGPPAAPDSLLGPMLAYLVPLRDRVRAAIAAGDSLASQVARAERDDPSRLPDAARWRLYRLHHPFNLTRAWSQLEWE